MQQGHVFSAIGIDSGSVPWLDGETVVLIPNAAVMDMDVAACDIKTLALQQDSRQSATVPDIQNKCLSAMQALTANLKGYWENKQSIPGLRPSVLNASMFPKS